MHDTLGLVIGATDNQVWWHMAAIPALGAWKQERVMFRVILGFRLVFTY